MVGSQRGYSSNLIPDIPLDSDSSVAKALQRGTGGRASFNGRVVTVFGATGCLASRVIPDLCAAGCQVIIPYRREPKKFSDLRVNGELGQILYMVRNRSYSFHAYN